MKIQHKTTSNLFNRTGNRMQQMYIFYEVPKPVLITFRSGTYYREILSGLYNFLKQIYYAVNFLKHHYEINIEV